MNAAPVQDAVVIGAGPSGLFAAWRLATGGARVTLLEAGGGMRASLCAKVEAQRQGRTVREAEKFRLQCHRCDCLTGVGGAAFHFDTNLGYVGGLSRSKIEVQPDGRRRSYSGLERALGDFDRASAAVADIYRLMRQMGVAVPEADDTPRQTPTVPPEGFDVADASTSVAITVDESLLLVDALLDAAVAAGADVRLAARAEQVERVEDGTWMVRVNGAEIRTRSVIVGVGKLGVGWVTTLLDAVGAEYRSSGRVDVGVRVETLAQIAAPLTDGCLNPKLTFVNPRDEPVRTFCVCEGGRIMQYAFGDAVVLDGQHCITTPTRRTNFGVITTAAVPDGTSGTEFALDYARRVTRAGGGLPVAQSLVELLGGALGGERPGTSLVRAAWTDLGAVLGPGMVDDVRRMSELLEPMMPGLIGPETVVAAPVIERVFPDIVLSHDLESTAPGLYFVGDSSSKIIGVTYGAATGVVAADAVLQR
ncbi:NAD(P)-binding protein [Cellulomonas taurus]|uniref:NAD(P)-binding protein n=1 Tax=Cellulomonas taurus TaxID=2729175 RepID=UPI00145FC520|nr:NAD(P)/FAD-dependent oxidoreductase [Cellulomonas taurus]